MGRWRITTRPFEHTMLESVLLGNRSSAIDTMEGSNPTTSRPEARRKLIQRQPGFWRNLEPIPLGFEIVKCLKDQGFGLHVLTKGPASTPWAWSEKVEWAQKYLPDALVTITSDKAKFYGRVLVDDFPPYFLKWLGARPRGLVICVAQPWNADFAVGGPKESPNIFRYDGSNSAGLKNLIEKAYNRSSREHVFGDSETV